MRTAMRVTNHVRPLRQRMARSMLAYRGAGRDNADFAHTEWPPRRKPAWWPRAHPSPQLNGRQVIMWA
jgi:hypothetical protein